MCVPLCHHVLHYWVFYARASMFVGGRGQGLVAQKSRRGRGVNEMDKTLQRPVCCFLPPNKTVTSIEQH